MIVYTDSNGYVKLQIQSKGDVNIALSKVGYPIQNFIINLDSRQDIVREIRLTQSGQPQIKTETENLPNSSKKVPNTPNINSENLSSNSVVDIGNLVSEFQNFSRTSSENVECTALLIAKNDINRLSVYRNISGLRTRVFEKGGNEYIAKRLIVGSDSTSSYAISNLKLINGIGVKVVAIFEGIPLEVNSLTMFEISLQDIDERKKHAIRFDNINIKK